MPESVSAASVGCGGGSCDAAAMRTCTAGRGATSAVALHASVTAASHRLCSITPAAARLQDVNSTHSECVMQNCCGRVVHSSKQGNSRVQRAHAACKPHKLAAAITCQGCLVSYRPLAAAFVFSSKIPSMRCVTSRCVALDGCYSAGQQSAAPAGRASRARYKSNDRVDKREEPKGLSHGHVLVRHATMQIWAA